MDIEQNLKDNLKEMMGYVLRHVIAIVCKVQFKNGTQQEFIISGFVIKMKDKVIAITAGHILEWLETKIRSGEIVQCGGRLVDFLGKDAKHHNTYPFTIFGREHYYMNEKGYDFALLNLDYMEQQAIASNGVIPFVFEGQNERPITEYTWFGVVGFAEEGVNRAGGKPDGDIEGFSPSMSPAALINDLKDRRLENLAISQPCILAQLIDDEFPKSMKGLSGGPVLGVSCQHDKTDYWVVGIQAEWFEEARITSICPMHMMFQKLRDIIVERRAKIQEGTTSSSHSNSERLEP